MNKFHQLELALAKDRLTTISIAARASSMLGAPIEGAIEQLPNPVRTQVNIVTSKALEHALGAALFTLSDSVVLPSNRGHKVAVAASGAAGGAFGIVALGLELPISTTIILRSIADIARSEGEDMQSLSTKLTCMEVLALGGTMSTDDAAESGYFAIRVTLAKAVTEATTHIAQQGLSHTASPALVRFISQIAARFSIPVSQKVAAQAIPAIGAVGGAIINTIFMEHFQKAAQGHFVIRRLERIYGADTVRDYY